MKTSTIQKRCIFLLGIYIVIFLSGCIVYSVNPFYTKDTIIDLPVLEGTWQPLEKDKKGQAEKAWIFKEDTLSIEGVEEKAFSVEYKCFKVGKNIYIDTTIGECIADSSFLLAFHVIPSHHLCKIELDGDRLSLYPISFSWLYDAIENKTISLPSLRLQPRKLEREPAKDSGIISFLSEMKKRDGIIFTASSQQWITFLKKYGSEKDLFSEPLPFSKVSKTTLKEKT